MFSKNYATCDFFTNTFVCTVFDRSTDTIFMRNYQIIIWLKVKSLQWTADGNVCWKLLRLRAILSLVKLHRSWSCNLYAYEWVANVRLQFMEELSALRSCQYLCSTFNIAMRNNFMQHSQFLMCKLHEFPVMKLGLFIRPRFLDHNFALEKKYAYASRTSCFHKDAAFYNCSALLK